MSAHASQAFSIVHCTDSEDLPNLVISNDANASLAAKAYISTARGSGLVAVSSNAFGVTLTAGADMWTLGVSVTCCCLAREVAMQAQSASISVINFKQI